MGKPNKKIRVIIPGKLDLRVIEEIWRGHQPISLAKEAKVMVDKSASLVAKAAQSRAPRYGINTGFGKLASVAIPSDDTALLQRNLILSHCCGMGEPLDAPTTRLMMVLKLNSLGRGASGVRWELLEFMETLLAEDCLPVIPSQGSVGASGDLAPLAHMAAALLGEGQVIWQGKPWPAATALAKLGLSPLVLAAKEGLALINGTQFSTAVALSALCQARRLFNHALIASALATDAIMGSTAPLLADLHHLRGHRGQIDTAAILNQLLEGSLIRSSHLEGDSRVQDPYCIRCQPQVAGAALDLLRFAAQTLHIEANAVTDNPLVLTDRGEIVSGGNFHAEPVAFAADQMALALAELGSIAQRRIAMMVDPNMSFGLPAFLSPQAGLNSGYMIAEVTSAALMSENKHLANPCSTDSIPTSANQEDHVSMAAHGSYRLLRMIRNLSAIIAIESLAAVQAIEFRTPLTTSPRLQKIIQQIRQVVPRLERDRYMQTDLVNCAKLMQETELMRISGLPPLQW